jgi:hypothetical protein
LAALKLMLVSETSGPKTDMPTGGLLEQLIPLAWERI